MSVLDADDPLLQAAPKQDNSDRQDKGEVLPLTAEDDEVLKEFYQEVRECDRDNEVNRILGAFKLNPYEQLGVHFDVTVDDINRAYRKVSLLVHPDKCRHPRAKDAFDVLRQAQQSLLDEEKKKEVDYLLNFAREELRKERQKATKHDSAIRVASLLHEEGRAGVEAQWEQTAEFHEKWKAKARDVIARAEWRRRKLNKRMKEEEARIEAGEKDEKDRLKRLREHHKGWEATRENRVGTWRDFVKKKEDKGKKKTALGGLRPPKSKTWDEEKTYVQRPVGEQFRPPPHAVPKPN